jgi:hypothetical protein
VEIRRKSMPALKQSRKLDQKSRAITVMCIQIFAETETEFWLVDIWNLAFGELATRDMSIN